MPSFHINPDLLRDKKCYSDFLFSSEDCLCMLLWLGFFFPFFIRSFDGECSASEPSCYSELSLFLCFIYLLFLCFFFSFPLYPAFGLTLFCIALHTEHSVSLGAFLLCALLQKINTCNFHKFYMQPSEISLFYT